MKIEGSTMEKTTNMKLILQGIFEKNPILFLLLGMCPTLAVTTRIEYGIGMGLATGFVLIFSCVIISAMRKVIPYEMRIPSFIIIIATFVTIISYIMEAYAPLLFRDLGIYVPLIVVNCIVLGKVLSSAYKNPIIPSFFDAVGTGAGFTIVLVIIAGIRQFLGEGSIYLIIFGKELLNLSFPGINMMILPPGALLTMGLILAVINAFKKDTVNE